jgi:hypothetical protein
LLLKRSAARRGTSGCALLLFATALWVSHRLIA